MSEVFFLCFQVVTKFRAKIGSVHFKERGSIPTFTNQRYGSHHILIFIFIQNAWCVLIVYCPVFVLRCSSDSGLGQLLLLDHHWGVGDRPEAPEFGGEACSHAGRIPLRRAGGDRRRDGAVLQPAPAAAVIPGDRWKNWRCFLFYTTYISGFSVISSVL